MLRLFNALHRYFFPERHIDPQELQSSFRAHYHHFRGLLTANNNALELMAEAEQMLDSGRPFGMAFVRGNCTALSVNVYKMIKHLTALADGGYAGLPPRFKEISGRIESILDRQPTIAAGPHILGMDQIDRSSIDLVGEKMANLGEIRNRVGLNTPDGFAVTATAAGDFMAAGDLQAEINRRLKSLDVNNLEELYTTSAAVQQLISNASLPEELETQIQRAYFQLAARAGSEILVAMRSSALGEDGMRVSFAGQYRTQLNVAPEFLGRTYKEILAGKYKSQAIVYRQQRGYRHQDVVMCVGCLAMVNAVVSGVTYSRPPGEPRADGVLIHAVQGLASGAVDGDVPHQLWRVARFSPHPVLSNQPGVVGAPLMPTSRLAELAEVAVRLEDHFGSPQDIEWSYDETGRLYILQSRPLGDPEDMATPAPPPAPADLAPPMLAGGTTVSPGVACGVVYKVASSLDLLRFPPGGVLVVKSPYPDWAVLVNRATAIVSETGQAAAHLATVAREFGVPALFGVKDAFTRLGNGQAVTVDATGRQIHPGRVEALLSGQPNKPALMRGSPIEQLLREVLRQITPLNLTDPASPYFRTSACETLHDLTRFCHEKAVQEMFRFGDRHGFDERSARQLVVETPFQWWVINLDDGFVETAKPDKHFINLSDIRSAPMQALWQGMTAIPWAGPPPVDLGGLGSIIFQSTRNPRLDPAVSSGLNARNYFLVAKNFCNLSVRLGYHLALAEANLSEYLTESYISFQFKGGAADSHRRLLRVNLLGDILEAFDFRVEIKGDNLSARIEKQPRQYLEKRLMVLGYLLIHTRQIDMVMADEEVRDQHRSKILADLALIIPNHDATA
ncbi:MAG: pyruvate, water dikinase [Desulfobulbaceae bacterium]|nr:pyruvate, water dikinase [Desulfobulbaceae bacterium]